jgi:hypothetical protein
VDDEDDEDDDEDEDEEEALGFSCFFSGGHRVVWLGRDGSELARRGKVFWAPVMTPPTKSLTPEKEKLPTC